MILAGDIGGTNARLGLFDSGQHGLRAITSRRFATRDHDSLEQIVSCFLSEWEQMGNRGEITAACFGVAGPVTAGHCQGLNMAWAVDENALQAQLPNIPIRVINDLVANAKGISGLTPADYKTIHEGQPNPQGNMAILSAGTGLGVAGMSWSGGGYQVFPSEGGHADFSPQTDEDVALLGFLRKRFGHESWERIVSGSGLLHIYEFLRDRQPDSEPDWLRDALAAGDRSACIATHGQDGSSDLCRRTLQRFAHYYGSLAGNLALQLLTSGGIWLGGGISLRLADLLSEPAFLSAFFSKGRIRYLLEATPVHIVLNDRTGLLGAALWTTDSAHSP